MIDVKQRGLRPFKEDRLAIANQTIQKRRRIHNEWTQPLAEAEVIVADRFRVDLLRTAQGLKDSILLFDLSADFLCESLRCDQIGYAKATASGLVFVGWANASQRGSNFSFAELLFAGRFQCTMVGENDMTPVGYKEPIGEIDPKGGNGVGFFKKCDRIQDHASTNNALHSVMKYAARHQVQHMACLSKRDRVAGIVPALVTGNTVEFPGEDVDDFTLAFISPLETYDS